MIYTKKNGRLMDEKATDSDARDEETLGVQCNAIANCDGDVRPRIPG
jgi:hypothetical protein